MKKKLLCFLAIFIVLFSSLAFAQKDSLDVSKKAAVEDGIVKLGGPDTGGTRLWWDTK